MKRILFLAVLLSLAAGIVAAQVLPAPPAPPAPPTPPVAPAPPAPPAPPAIPAWAGPNWQGTYLGIGVQEIDDDRAKELKLPETRGVEVTTVVEGSPAGKAGLKEGDVVLEFNGQRIESVAQFTRMVHETPVGRTVKLLVSRDGKNLTLTPTIVKRARFGDPNFDREMKKFGEDMQKQFGPGSDFEKEMKKFGEDMQKQFGPGSDFEKEMKKFGEDMGRQFGERSEYRNFGRTGRLGVDTETVGSQLREFFGVSQGVLVKTVERGSPAEKAGLKAGDVITKIGNTEIARPGDIRAALSEATGKPVLVTVVRNKRPLTLTVTVEKPPSHAWMQPRHFRFQFDEL